MKLKLNKLGYNLKKAAPTILALLGVGGVIGTAYVASKAGEKKAALKKQAEEERLTKSETFFLVAPSYIPTVGVAAGTIACILGSNVLNRKQQAALISAYALLERSYLDHKNKVIELIGEDGEKEIAQEIAMEKLAGAKPPEDGKVLFYDEYSQRYFPSTENDVLAAEYHLNRNFILRGYCELNEFYWFLGIDKTDYGSTVGWSTYIGPEDYGYQWIDFTHEHVDVDGMECIIIRMPFQPHLDYLD